MARYAAAGFAAADPLPVLKGPSETQPGADVLGTAEWEPSSKAATPARDPMAPTVLDHRCLGSSAAQEVQSAGPPAAPGPKPVVGVESSQEAEAGQRQVAARTGGACSTSPEDSLPQGDSRAGVAAPTVGVQLSSDSPDVAQHGQQLAGPGAALPPASAGWSAAGKGDASSPAWQEAQVPSQPAAAPAPVGVASTAAAVSSPRAGVHGVAVAAPVHGAAEQPALAPRPAEDPVPAFAPALSMAVDDGCGAALQNTAAVGPTQPAPQHEDIAAKGSSLPLTPEAMQAALLPQLGRKRSAGSATAVPGGTSGSVAAAGSGAEAAASSAGAHGLGSAAVWPQEAFVAAANLATEGPSDNVTLRRKKAKGSRSMAVLEHALVQPTGEREALPATYPASIAPLSAGEWQEYVSGSACTMHRCKNPARARAPTSPLCCAAGESNSKILGVVSRSSQASRAAEHSPGMVPAAAGQGEELARSAEAVAPVAASWAARNPLSAAKLESIHGDQGLVEQSPAGEPCSYPCANLGSTWALLYA